MYKGTLISAGLSPKQAAVYEASLETGPAKVPEIALQAHLKRTTVYGIVDELVALGLLQESYRGKRKLYKAEDPRAILSMLEQKKKQIADILPELSDLFVTHNVRPRVTFFEGREGVKKIYDDALECKSKEIKEVVRVRQHNEAVGDAFIRDFIKRRIDEAAKFVPLDQLALSPQCGFSSTAEGNLLSADDQWAKLRLVAETAREVWG